jgi:hypothetical protein
MRVRHGSPNAVVSRKKSPGINNQNQYPVRNFLNMQHCDTNQSSHSALGKGVKVYSNINQIARNTKGSPIRPGTSANVTSGGAARKNLLLRNATRSGS